MRLLYWECVIEDLREAHFIDLLIKHSLETDFNGFYLNA